MSQPLVSVIIPVYNMEKYISRCLDSVLNNTYRNLEVICIDDGSKDNSLGILREYEAKDSRVIVIAKKNGGVSSARNAGLDRMSGEYVCFVDPDDYVHPQYVELLYATLLECKTDVAICGHQIVDANTSLVKPELYSIKPDAVHVCPLVRFFRTQELRAYCWGKIIRYELVKNVRFCEELSLAEDTTFVAELYEKGNLDGTAVLTYPLYYYFIREGSAVRDAKTSQLLQFGKVWTQRLYSGNRDNIYLDKAIRWYLSLRYEYSHLFPDLETRRECKNQLMKLRSYVWKTDIYRTAEKAGILAYIYFPRLYRFHRIMGDPSTLNWEKVERKKRQAAKKAQRQQNREAKK